MSSLNDQEAFAIAVEEAKISYQEGGVPIGAALISKDGKLLGRGHNMRVQKGSAIHHGETSALENSGRLPASAYKGATMFTTTGACILYGISRVVIGENKTFLGGEAYLKQRGIEVVNMQNDECQELMEKFISEKPDLWNEDIGVEKRVYSKEG
ncbi:cytidine and deoxycytidylate deaminase zinc-binding region protein [Rutstroemia sp. NJR-2017a WRK4]|nr:cytidine and deoxycytidylate deaminase zinc-binding region protein [Rutstroemia sp. NJR-2017a BBW]PQE08652.1 cytidine and deoxycytidylate deaminase zinc-binding region protein [Rutstroemia sp. NJR-2017a BBW]PQE31589.1 cytidine and deoxycytidylate deaminase zinc-binding region protein [Rutstroemia sp. NJR-2017a WRK4]